jgi:HK97 family phage major capsid protein
MDDAPNFDQMLSQAMTAAVAAGLDYAFINGTGAGQPLGVINGPSTITVAKESAQAANTLLLQNLANMVGRLLPASFARSVWFVHPTLIPLLYQMSYTTKNVAGSENVGGGHVQAVGHDSAGNLTIFGRPALVTDACSVLSAKGDIVLCDPMRYLITMRSDVRLARDASAYFGSDEVAFRLTLRLDGTPEDAEPTKLRDGTNTVSPFVTLAAR